MKALKIFLPPLILLTCGTITFWLTVLKKEPERRDPPPVTTRVDAVRLQKRDFPVILESQGTVRARTESTLIPEVSGSIVEISPAFRSGEFFEEGDVLLKIDPRDYGTALVVAEATLSQAQLRLAEEEARVEQAIRDWEKLGAGEEPGPLVLRKPQLAEAKQSAGSAEAKVEEARRDLERTQIKAPYAGRILEKRVDVGQYVTPGTVLARIYAVDYAEIRLPLSNRQLSFINLPELYRGESATAGKNRPKVTLKALFGQQEYTWKGRIVRTEGSIDTRSRQLFVVAQVKNPYGRSQADRPPLKVGMFVKAEIEGNVMKDVFTVPRSALREGRDVLLIDEENKLAKRSVEILWSDQENIVVGDSLKAGEVLCLTPLSFAAEGAPVDPQIQGEAVAEGKGTGGDEAGNWQGGGNERGVAGKPKGKKKGPS